MRNRGNKQKTNNNKMAALSPNMSVITSNISGLNTLFKRVGSVNKKCDPTLCIVQEIT